MKKIVNCETCNSELLRLPYQIKASKTGLFFCNRDCKSKWHSIQFENMKLEKKCKNCNNIIRTQKSKIDNTEYCSRKCLGKSKSNNGTISVTCENCSKKFTRIKSQVKGNNLCSIKCRSEWNANKCKDVELTCNICDCKYTTKFIYKDKSKTCSKKCGAKWKSHLAKTVLNEQYIQRGINSVLKMKKYDTKPELIVEEELIKNNINYIKQYKICNKYLVDFYLPEKNIIIEVFGDYWHVNPRIYGEGRKPLNKYQMDKIKKDELRINNIKMNGYDLYILWEFDIINDLKNIITPIINLYP